ncbi:DUF3152 domain-containing protein [Fodinicola feengrottensis]|uniref:DUF3152 domain-containing protein n=1 Tax=Fodinicola feengrottensis TaxID=435914 RepID=UPI0013D60D1A|nr:DUF3152 domain-containing protein [Fodinicola feengrottensis]
MTDREARRSPSRTAPARSRSTQSRPRPAQSRAAKQQALQRRRWTVLAVLAVTLVLVSVDLTNGLKDRSAAGDTTTAQTPAPATSAVRPAAPVVTGPSPSAGPSTAAPQPSDSPAPPGVVDQGAGTFTAAPGGTGVVGHGTLLTYRVEVENGTGQQAAAFAAEVDKILDDPRSWTAAGKIAFQRVSTGTPGVTIRLASPKTVDRLCFPLTTDGYTSCRVGDGVVINLARWLTAVPDFVGHLDLYREYAVNHEVGHRLGHGHMACPAAGQLAPVMQQQTLGLKGCRINPWPYVDGKLVTGPAVP